MCIHPYTEYIQPHINAMEAESVKKIRKKKKEAGSDWQVQLCVWSLPMAALWLCSCLYSLYMLLYITESVKCWQLIFVYLSMMRMLVPTSQWISAIPHFIKYQTLMNVLIGSPWINFCLLSDLIPYSVFSASGSSVWVFLIFFKKNMFFFPLWKYKTPFLCMLIHHFFSLDFVLYCKKKKLKKKDYSQN